MTKTCDEVSNKFDICAALLKTSRIRLDSYFLNHADNPSLFQSTSLTSSVTI